MLKTIGKAIDLSALAYWHPLGVERVLRKEFEGFKWIEDEDKGTGTQCFICSDSDNTWVVFRGTEFDNLNDWITNLDCGFTACVWGMVHRGFWQAMESVKWQVMDAISRNIISGKRVIFTGHSQGAAIAELMFSFRCKVLPEENQICIPIEPPRSMSRKAAEIFGRVHGSQIYHVVNNNDVVCRVPPRVWGYGHVRNINLNYLDADGDLHHSITWWERFKDRVKGRLCDFGELGTDGVKDHKIAEIQRTWRNLV